MTKATSAAGIGLPANDQMPAAMAATVAKRQAENSSRYLQLDEGIGRVYATARLAQLADMYAADDGTDGKFGLKCWALDQAIDAARDLYVEYEAPSEVEG